MSRLPSQLQQQTDDAMTEIRSLAANDGEAGLSEIAVVLRRLASTQTWQEASLVAASPGEEVLYELDVTADGPSLYLVSDGQGVTSPPHEHGTWAVIAGVRGAEANVQFRPLSGRLVAPIDRVVVGAGESLVLSADAIHATEVVGAEPTFHLHLYGKPLRELSSFASRVFAGQAERENRA